MRTLRTLCLATALATLAPAISPGIACAQPNSAEMKLHFQRGVKLYSEEDYRGAVVEFKRAYEVSNNNAILYNLGQTYFQLRDYANALKSFESYLQGSGASLPAGRRADVEKDIEDLKGRVAKLTVESSVAGATISIDDVAVGKTPLPGPLTVSAGQRKVTLTKEGIAPVTKNIEVAGGDKSSITLEPPPVVAQPSNPGKPTTTTPPPEEKTTSPGVFVGYGIAVAGLAVGTTFGILALGTKSDLNAVCKDNVCPTSSQSKGDTLSTQATVSTIGFGVGIIGAAIGTYFLIAGGSSSSKAQTITPYFTGSAGGFTGRF